MNGALGSTRQALCDAVSTALGADVGSARVLGGGDVAESFALELTDGQKVFAKTHLSPPAGFFTTEATGLRWLRDTHTVRVPEVLACSDGGSGVPFLALEWIEAAGRDHSSEVDLGRGLAELHRAPWSTFGRPDARTTGSRGLPNEPCDSWAEFYATQRLLPLARLARDAGVLSPRTCTALEMVASRLAELGGPAEPPSLLHGDLWAGNRLVDLEGRSWLIDPAAHGGHREFDLAMMRLFGGFGEKCFAAYADTRALAAGWTERVELHQIAPLVVHAVKFGGGYVPAASSAIQRYA